MERRRRDSKKRVLQKAGEGGAKDISKKEAVVEAIYYPREKR